MPGRWCRTAWSSTLRHRPDVTIDTSTAECYLFGPRGSALIQNAVTAGAPRSSSTDIENYMITLQ